MPYKVTTSIAAKTRGLLFALPGRILYNFFQSPIDTIEEVRTITFDLYYDVITSKTYLQTILFRQW